MEELSDKAVREIQPTINKVEKAKKDHTFNTVARHKTTLSIKNRREIEDKVDNKYRPSYKQIEKHRKLVPKWYANENEHSFFYEHNKSFKAKVDLDIS